MTYPHTTFSTECGVPSVSLSQEQKDLISTVMNEGAFQNPIAGKISESSDMVDSLSSTLEAYTGELDISGLVANIDALKGTDGMLANFTKHTNRLSGVDLSMDGDLFGFQGLQGIASSYNMIQETMKSPGDVVEDNYSQMFSSVLDSGQNMMGDISSKLSSITGLIDGLGNIDDLDGDMIANITSDLGGLASNLTDSINADNLHLSVALDKVTKFGLGMMVSGMGKDSCFGNKLLDNIATDAVKDGLNKL
jgi:hypothetical protein